MNENIQSSLLFTDEQQTLIHQLIKQLNGNQIQWLSGFFSGIGYAQGFETKISVPNNTTPNSIISNSLDHETHKLTIMFGSRTGNGTSIAKKAKDHAETQGFQVKLVDMNDFKPRDLKNEKNLLLISSTHGEGVPPTSAEELYNFLHSKKAVELPDLKYSVLALGDMTYAFFCKTGKDFDEKLEQLGAKKIYPRTDCDIDFDEDADKWIEGSINAFQELYKTTPKDISTVSTGFEKSWSLVYDKKNKWPAAILERIKLNGRGSEKETYHIELSLEGSGLTYEPGDTVGIIPQNSNRLVSDFFDATKLNPDQIVEINKEPISIFDALTTKFELSTIAKDTLKRYNEFVKSPVLQSVIDDPNRLKEFTYGRDIIDLIKEFPVQLNEQEFAHTLRKMHKRLYSISSSIKAHPEEVHLTVAAVKFKNTRYKEGVGSTFLTDYVDDDAKIKMYIDKNPDFKLPKNSDAPIIMVGPGTGIAPFRSFIEERSETGAKGKNWLFFGDRNFSTDFLYQIELQDYLKKGVLTKLHVAFSRDTDKKIYVQHKMKEHADELYRWLQDGAHFYVCGDMKYMWNDVNKTLLEIIEKQGGLSSDAAEEYLQEMKQKRRYQLDVY